MPGSFQCRLMNHETNQNPLMMRARVKEVANVSQALLGRAKKRGPLRRGRKAIDPHGAPMLLMFTLAPN